MYHSYVLNSGTALAHICLSSTFAELPMLLLPNYNTALRISVSRPCCLLTLIFSAVPPPRRAFSSRLRFWLLSIIDPLHPRNGASAAFTCCCPGCSLAARRRHQLLRMCLTPFSILPMVPFSLAYFIPFFRLTWFLISTKSAIYLYSETLLPDGA